MQTIAAILGVLVSAAVAAAQSPGFWLTGVAAGQGGSQVSSLSADGMVASGSSYAIGFTWTREGGRYDFGLEPGITGASVSYAISSDAGVLAGAMYPFNEQMQSRAFRRVGSGPLVDLGVVPGNTRSFARGLSGDGSVVVGGCEYSQSTSAFGEAFRWTPQGGMQGLGYARPLGTYSLASGISRDGTTIVGRSQSGGSAGHTDAFVWRENAGMQALPGLPGTTGWTAANAVSADGSVIVGEGHTATGALRAVRWTASGGEDLGVPPGGYYTSSALAVSDDGLVVGGRLSGQTFPFDTAFVWTPSTGIQPLSDYLTVAGISLPPNYQLASVRAISSDGLTFAGYAINLQTFVQEGFVATVPTPASGLVLLLLPALRRRQRPVA